MMVRKNETPPLDPPCVKCRHGSTLHGGVFKRCAACECDGFVATHVIRVDMGRMAKHG